jgi:signal transduction histidine kinase
MTRDAANDAGDPPPGAAAEPEDRQLVAMRLRQLRRELDWRHRVLDKVQKLASIGLWELDLATGTFLATENIYEMCGIPAGEATRTFDGVIARTHPDDRPLVAQWVRGGADDDRGLVFRIVRPDGAICHLYAERIDGSDGRQSGLVQDITERISSEAELRSAHARAEFASQVKSRFIAQMSHELRTPLNAITGFVDLLLDPSSDPLTGGQRAYLGDIQDAARLLTDLVDDILEMAKLDAGTVQLNFQLVDLEHLLERCARTLVPKARSRGVELSWSCAGGIPTIYADELRLRQVLLNLAGNAIKFTPYGGRVEISAAGDGDGCKLLVEDNGVGMTEDGVRRALEPFVQLDDGLNRHHEGAGLGLPIASRLVELHGGRLVVASEPGRGTCVTVSLPAHSAIG